LTIGNLDDHVISRLQERAQANERSLEGEIRHVLTECVNPRSRILQFRARVQQIAALTAGTPQTNSVALLREDRDR
jgi:plasmid stability protein